MPNFNFSDDEHSLLKEVVKSYLSELHTEIQRTDKETYKSMLKKKEDTLKEIVNKIS